MLTAVPVVALTGPRQKRGIWWNWSARERLSTLRFALGRSGARCSLSTRILPGDLYCRRKRSSKSKLGSSSPPTTSWRRRRRAANGVGPSGGCFERHDYLVVPTAQTFPFDLNMRWPQEIAGRKMETYHEWMKANCLISMSGLPALAAPAGFGLEGLPIGLQIVAPNRGELACLELAHAFERATDWTRARPPPLLSERQ